MRKLAHRALLWLVDWIFGPKWEDYDMDLHRMQVKIPAGMQFKLSGIGILPSAVKMPTGKMLMRRFILRVVATEELLMAVLAPPAERYRVYAALHKEFKALLRRLVVMSSAADFFSGGDAGEGDFFEGILGAQGEGPEALEKYIIKAMSYVADVVLTEAQAKAAEDKRSAAIKKLMDEVWNK
jgi:hypothetical protein